MLPQIDDLWDDEQEKHRFSKTIFVFLILGFLKGAGEVAGKADAGSLLTMTKRGSLGSRSIEYAALTVGTTKKALQAEIDAAVANGEGVKQLAGRINKLYGSSMGYRSVRIARSQLTDAVADGNLTALVDEGETEKEWSTVMDGKERESHHNANGQIVGIHEQFKLDGGYADRPGDPDLPPEESVNCRCDVVRPGLSDRQRRIHGRLFLRVHGILEKKYVVSLRRAFIAQRDRVLSRLPT